MSQSSRPSALTLAEIDNLRDRFEAAWQQGESPRIEDWLEQIDPSKQGWLLMNLLKVELECRRKSGEQPTLAEYAARFPARRAEVEEVFAQENSAPTPVLAWQSPRAVDPLAVTEDYLSDDSRTSSRGLPEFIARYRVEKALGEGGFGRVLLAYDDKLNRSVAIKVAHPHLLERPENIQLYLAEAQTVARLDHPHIVPVYDVGSTDEFPLYVISKYIDGEPLSARLKRSRMSFEQSASLAASIAEAVHYAHKQGLVHRDIKPANILLDAEGKPLLTDFGLALSEQEQRRRRNERSGSPAYMAPEQVAGKSHHLDGRTDVWSLGVVLYEMLTGRTPFAGASKSELFEEIREREPKPPRQIDDMIPDALQAIVLKCLTKRVNDRYATAADVAKDLRAWQSSQQEQLRLKRPRGSDLRSWFGRGVFAAALLLLIALATFWPPAAPVAPLEADLNVHVWRDDRFLPIEDVRARPVRTDDLIRVEARLNRPAYVYLAWIDSNGKAVPFYPGEPYDWSQWQTPPPQSEFVSFPEAIDGGVPLEGDPGMETFVLLARDGPLPAETRLAELFADLPPQPLLDDFALIYWDNGQLSRRKNRAPNFSKKTRVDAPVRSTQQLLQQRLSSVFPLIRSITFAHVRGD